MRQRNRLRPLQMGIAGKYGFRMLRRKVVQLCNQVFHKLFDCRNFLFGVHPRIQRDLVVAAAAGMQAFAHIANTGNQYCFDVHVDIFGFFVE